jgi:hypothetical protein
MPDTVIDTGVGGYVRWRGRMVRSSVFNDLKRTLTATGWLDTELEYPFQVREFFAEFSVYVQDAIHVNTMVIDNGDPTPIGEWELGGDMTRTYRFSLGFYAQDDETGLAVFSDLQDRYDGLTEIPYVALYNYNAATPPLIRYMEVEGFQYARAPQDAVPYEHHLFFAELMVRDFIDGDRTTMQP